MLGCRQAPGQGLQGLGCPRVCRCRRARSGTGNVSGFAVQALEVDGTRTDSVVSGGVFRAGGTCWTPLHGKLPGTGEKDPTKVQAGHGDRVAAANGPSVATGLCLDERGQSGTWLAGGSRATFPAAVKEPQAGLTSCEAPFSWLLLLEV